MKMEDVPDVWARRALLLQTRMREIFWIELGRAEQTVLIFMASKINLVQLMSCCVSLAKEAGRQIKALSLAGPVHAQGKDKGAYF